MTETAYKPTAEMFWRPDANVDAARKLAEWGAFHRLAGQHSVYFDSFEKSGRKYRCVAFTVRKPGENCYFVKLAEGQGDTVLAAIAAALDSCGVEVPGAAAMLRRGLAGSAITVPPPSPEFDNLLGGDAPSDDYEDLLG